MKATIWLDASMNLFSRNRPVSRDDFAAMIQERLRSQGFEALSYDAEEFSLRGEFGFATLHPGFALFNRSKGAERESVLAELVATLVMGRDHEASEDWSEAAQHLRPVVRSTRLHRHLDLMAQAEKRTNNVKTAGLEIAEGLSLELAYDTPRATASVPPELLAVWNVDFKTAMHTAIDNLRGLDELSFSRSRSGFLVGHVQDGYEASRMATPDLFHRLALTGDPVVLPAARNAILVAGSHEPEALRGMAEAGIDLLEEARWISFSPYVHDGESWNRFLLPAEHPATAVFRKLELLELRHDYDAQRPALGKLFGENMFIPQLLVGERDGTVRSFATWGEGVSALLPKADYIVFSLLDPEDPEAYGEAFDVSFSDVREVVGHRLTRLAGVEPHRFMVDSFPNANELDRLRERSVDLVSGTVPL